QPSFQITAHSMLGSQLSTFSSLSLKLSARCKRFGRYVHW
ncbi:MAG: hypothetical protein ACI9RO_000306, partial [Alteromonas macleodii]